MRILVTGSREWADWHILGRAFVELQEQHAERGHDDDGRFVDWLMPDWTVVHGACPTGADAMADEWAIVNLVRVERHPAKWQEFGRGAGILRNQEMVDAGADICLAFIVPGEGKSRGTRDCVRRAITANIEVRTFHPQITDVVEGLP